MTLRRSTLTIAVTVILAAACGGGGGGGDDGGEDPPVRVEDALAGCAPAPYDRWTLPVGRGQDVRIGLDTTSSGTAADLCVVGRCGGVDLGGDDEQVCTYAPERFACPSVLLSTRRAGHCTFDVTLCSDTCANQLQADYALTVSIEGGGAVLEQVGEDLSASQRRGLCRDGERDSQECDVDSDCPGGTCLGLPRLPPTTSGTVASPPSSTLPPDAVSCRVSVRVTTSSIYRALRFKLDYSKSEGALDGHGRQVACSRTARGSSLFNDFDAARVLSVTLLSGAGVTGPTKLIECELQTTAAEQLAADDFSLAVLEATGPSGATIDPGLEVDVDCDPSETTTTGTMPNGSVPTSSTTTLPQGLCGELLASWGGLGAVAGRFNRPVGIAADPRRDSVFVVDSTNNRVQRFNAAGSFVRAWGTPGPGEGEFNEPAAVDVDPQGNVYVVDSGNHRIQKFDAAGGFLLAWGTLGGGDGKFRFPSGIAVDPDGFVYVSDQGNARVQKFGGSGEFVLEWGVAGGGRGEFLSPEGIAAGEKGNVFVADSQRDRILKFDPDGEFVTEFGSSGHGDGQLSRPVDVLADAGGNLLVVDSGNNRVQKLSSRGLVVAAWGSEGSEPGLFDGLLAIAGLGGPFVVVADTGNHRVQTFRCE